jgi:hypothetical protein
VLAACAAHLAPAGRLAFIVSPHMEDGRITNLPRPMANACEAAGLAEVEQISVPYQTEQITGVHVNWARRNRRLLKAFRSLYIFGKS